jgi:hypothetical protein
LWRQQGVPEQALEVGASKIGQRNRKENNRVSLSAGNKQMEQNRTPVVCVYLKELAGIPLTDRALVVSLIGATTTSAGLTVRCVLDESEYERGIKISDEEFGKINITNADFHGEWNYSISINL